MIFTKEGSPVMDPIVAFALNLAVAFALGFVVGLEREFRLHTAGLRTHILVSVGAALFVGVAVLDPREPPHRIVGQVVTGLGFLGGGVILHEGLNVKGLNSAATIWCIGGVGTLAGAGYWLAACCGAGAILIVHLTLRPLTDFAAHYARQAVDVETEYRVRVECLENHDRTVRQALLRHVKEHPTLGLTGLATQEVTHGRLVVIASILSPQRDDHALDDIVAKLVSNAEVKAAGWTLAGSGTT
jgi:putative Mg2+ transporter-C (MgtC) family protein